MIKDIIIHDDDYFKLGKYRVMTVGHYRIKVQSSPICQVKVFGELR